MQCLQYHTLNIMNVLGNKLMNDSICPHLNGHFQSLKYLLSIFVENKLRCVVKQILLSNCTVCNKLSARVHVCIKCAHLFCFEDLKSHFESTGHSIGMDISQGQLFCFQCKDYIFNEEVESILKVTNCELSHRINIINTKDVNSFKSIADNLPIPSEIGLKGLVNLGNTCFMNCIIQTLVHTPLFENFLVGHFHTCADKSFCVLCEIIDIMQEFYSNDDLPIIPHKLLYKIWQNSKYLIGYEQQDAHEFFIFLLGLFHKKINEKTTKEIEPDNCDITANQCHCIIDQIFNGFLKSELTCQHCSSTSCKIDPFWDISLDLDFTSKNDLITLLQCLDRYTRKEHLGNETHIECKNCGVTGEFSKQLSMFRLPLILCIHLKRFEHSIKSKKITNKIQFPLELDMYPYLSSMTGTKNDKHAHRNNLCNQYSLFAVINHNGTLEMGHYFVYIKHKFNQWYKLDDSHVSRSTIKEVLNSEVYLLLYHKKKFDYVN